MKILHIITYPQGGAYIAAKRHHEAMLKKGIDSRILTINGVETLEHSIYVVPLYKRIFNKLVSYLLSVFNCHVVRKGVWHWNVIGYDLSRLDVVKEADVIYLHWTNFFLNIQGIEMLLKSKKKIVFFMHDMWYMTGGCHYSFDCRNYEEECENCFLLRNKYSVLAYKQLRVKIKVWEKYNNFVVAAPSIWLTKCAQKSSLFRAHPVFCCPNVINVNKYHPVDKIESRKELGLPLNKKIIVFCSMSLTDSYKGASYLFAALSKLDLNEYSIIMIGNSSLEHIPLRIRNIIHLSGFISNPDELIKYYSAGDVFVIPSIAENFPNVVLEAMACGLPVVGFSTGGIKDQIEHKYNGYLVEPKDVDGLCKGICWVLNIDNYSVLSENCRKWICSKYSYDKVMSYHSFLLNNKKNE